MQVICASAVSIGDIQDILSYNRPHKWRASNHGEVGKQMRQNIYPNAQSLLLTISKAREQSGLANGHTGTPNELSELVIMLEDPGRSTILHIWLRSMRLSMLNILVAKDSTCTSLQV